VSEAPLVSIVVVTFNAPGFVRKCIEDIRSRTHVPYELIVVDNASEAETRDYLRSVPGIRLIENRENRLWCAACNQGMRAADARAKYLLLLNSDVEILRDDWLELLVAVMESGPRVGLVGPKRNAVPVGPLWGYLDGFCLLIRRSLAEEIGYFDEERWPWSGAPAEFAVAAWSRGWIYKVVHPRDACVFHHEDGSQTPEFKASLKKYPRIRREFAGIMARYGLRPELPWGERWRFLKPLDRWLEKRRFYVARPVGRRP
jgi:GT2 family glycosyltransferase